MPIDTTHHATDVLRRRATPHRRIMPRLFERNRTYVHLSLRLPKITINNIDHVLLPLQATRTSSNANPTKSTSTTPTPTNVSTNGCPNPPSVSSPPTLRPPQPQPQTRQEVANANEAQWMGIVLSLMARGRVQSYVRRMLVMLPVEEKEGRLVWLLRRKSMILNIINRLLRSGISTKSSLDDGKSRLGTVPSPPYPFPSFEVANSTTLGWWWVLGTSHLTLSQKPKLKNKSVRQTMHKQVLPRPAFQG